MKKSFRIKLAHLVLLLSLTTSLFAQVNHWETAVFNSDTWKYLVPKSEPDLQWRSLSFNDLSWSSGPGGFGYSNNDDGTVIWKQGDGPKPTSVYMRIKFTVSDTSKIASAVFHMDYDDAFVAYLNDVEIARVGLTGLYPAYDQMGTNHDAVMFNGGLPDEFVLDKKTLSNCLQKGSNVLTIQVHNSSTNSSDMSSNAFLSFGIKDASVFFRKTPSWFTPPAQSGPLATYLPIILINTNGVTIPDEPKIAANMKIIHHGGTAINTITDEPNIYDGNIGIEVRGSTSAYYPQTPYGIETRDILDANLDTALLGMPRDNDWVLLSNWNEKTFSRNILSFNIFNKMGHYSPRVRLCEVFINDDYRGVYLFGEKIKRGKGRVDIANLTPIDLRNDSVTGGYIFKTDYDDGSGTYWNSNYSPINRPGGIVKFVYHEPQAKDLQPEQKDYIASYVNSTEQALYSNNFTDPVTGYRAYIDVNSFIDYWILEELARNVDGYKKSRFFYKDKDSKDKLIYSGPCWDFDWAWKNLYDCSLLSNTTGAGWAYKINECNVSPIPPSWEVRMLEDPAFANAVNARYFNLRKSVLSLESIYHTIDSVASLVNEAQVRHFKKYNTLGINNGAPEIDAIPKTYAGEVQKLKDWVATRLAWLDANMVGTSGTGVENVISTARIRVFPNPVQETLYVESDNDIRNITLFNAQGNAVMNFTPKNSDTSINISKLSPGLYIVKVTLTNGSSVTQKLTKE